ncbi:MAG: carbon storage regulator CsrA [Planctomycetota bacterium]
MLVLSRRPKQRIVIDDDIVITVVEIDRHGQVRIGIEAPRKYRVLRYELYEQIQEENRQAARAGAADATVLDRLRFPGRPDGG